MLSVIMPSVVMLNVVMLCIIMLNVVKLSVVTVNVIMLSGVASKYELIQTCVWRSIGCGGLWSRALRSREVWSLVTL
jgi:hypothetical protein